MTRSVQIGIDVGGTFTHAVAWSCERQDVLASAQVPTTHGDEDGVAAGVLQALEQVLARARLGLEEVRLVSYSTTQATNALLEGDTARVGIIGMGGGAVAAFAEAQTRLGDMDLGNGLSLATLHRHVPSDGAAVAEAVESMLEAGAQVFVVSEAFGVDGGGENERSAAERCRQKGLLATAASELSRLHGLRLRTRTAVLNASILPVMLRTAHRTERGVRALGLETPLLVMRSDGGVMPLDEMRRRPIQTVLSGPAAGVAAAVMHSGVSDGIFLEVGGTSTDISVLVNGRARVSGARVGGHRVALRALDITTVGIGGGSMPVLSGGQIVAVGPRSAHIAGHGYAAFIAPSSIERCSPGKADGPLGLASPEGLPPLTVTPTCAANLLGRYGPGDWGRGDPVAVEAAIRTQWGRQVRPLDVARRIEALAAGKVARVVEQLVREHALDRECLTLVGGGGGARAVVPAVAELLGLPYRIVEHAPVISAIGTAIAMLRETVERSVASPGDADLLSVRREAWERLAAAGARPDTIEVEVEVEPARNVIRATASGSIDSAGSTGFAVPGAGADPGVFPAGCGPIAELARTRALVVYAAERERAALFGLVRRRERHVRVVDSRGIVRLQKRGGALLARARAHLSSGLRAFLAEHAVYGDGGREAPEVQLLHGSRVFDLSGVAHEDSIAALIEAELAGCPPEEPVVVIATPR